MVFSDAGFTGANTKRPAFTRLMAQVVGGQIDVVVVYKVDRLSRSLLDFSKIMGVFEKHHVAFVSITQDFSTATALGRLTLNILMSFSEFEREMISERTGDKIEASRRKGKWTGGLAPLGYEVRDRKLYVIPSEAARVRDIFEWASIGHSAAWIAKQLNDLEVPYKTMTKPRPRPWTRYPIVKILRNCTYAGLMSCRGGASAQGEHEAIITPGVFDAVQVMRSPKVRQARNLHYNPLYIARGALVCATCDRPVSTSCVWNSLSLRRYYRCSSRAPGGGRRCKTRNVLAERIEKALLEAVDVHLRLESRWPEILKNQFDQLQKGKRKLRADLIESSGGNESLNILQERWLRTLHRVEEHLKWFSGIINNHEASWPKLTLTEKNRFIRTIVLRATVVNPPFGLEVVFRDFSGDLFIPEELGG